MCDRPSASRRCLLPLSVSTVFRTRPRHWAVRPSGRLLVPRSPPWLWAAVVPLRLRAGRVPRMPCGPRVGAAKRRQKLPCGPAWRDLARALPQSRPPPLIPPFLSDSHPAPRAGPARGAPSNNSMLLRGRSRHDAPLQAGSALKPATSSSTTPRAAARRFGGSACLPCLIYPQLISALRPSLRPAPHAGAPMRRYPRAMKAYGSLPRPSSCLFPPGCSAIGPDGGVGSIALFISADCSTIVGISGVLTCTVRCQPTVRPRCSLVLFVYFYSLQREPPPPHHCRPLPAPALGAAKTTSRAAPRPWFPFIPVRQIAAFRTILRALARDGHDSGSPFPDRTAPAGQWKRCNLA